jgi:hypothetical protein
VKEDWGVPKPDKVDADIQQCIPVWLERTASNLRAAGGDRTAIIAVYERYLDEGMVLVYSPSAMWDYLNSVMQLAGTSRQEKDRLYRIFSTVTQQKFRGGQPYPPDWPWHENEPSDPTVATERPLE